MWSIRHTSAFGFNVWSRRFCDGVHQLKLCQLNQDGYNPLHLAAANGHVEIVKYLLDRLPGDQLCMTRDRDGRTALHCAVVTGKGDVIDTLFVHCPEAAMDVTDQGESVLHLAVKHHYFEALKFLVGKLRSLAADLLNRGDRKGNTVLHLATARRQLQTVEYLVKQPSLDVNVENSYGLRALDIIFACALNPNDLYVEEAISLAGGCPSSRTGRVNTGQAEPNILGSTSEQRGTLTNIVQAIWDTSDILRSSNQREEALVDMPDVSALTSNQTGRNSIVQAIGDICNILRLSNRDWLEEIRSGIIVMASLIATLTFQVALAPPGGVWQDYSGPNDEHKLGKSIFYDLDRHKYNVLMGLNINAFLSSMVAIVALPAGRETMVRYSVYCFLACITGEFFIIIELLAGKKLLVKPLYMISIVFWLATLGIYLMDLF